MILNLETNIFQLSRTVSVRHHTVWEKLHVLLMVATIIPAMRLLIYVSSSWLCHLPAVQPCDLGKLLTCVCLCLLIYKMGILTTSTAYKCREDSLSPCIIIKFIE